MSALSDFLDELRDVMRMTEAATIRVLDETEALVDDGLVLAEIQGLVDARGGIATPAPAAFRRIASDSRAGQGLADELLPVYLPATMGD